MSDITCTAGQAGLVELGDVGVGVERLLRCLGEQVECAERTCRLDWSSGGELLSVRRVVRCMLGVTRRGVHRLLLLLEGWRVAVIGKVVCSRVSTSAGRVRLHAENVLQSSVRRVRLGLCWLARIRVSGRSSSLRLGVLVVEHLVKVHRS